MKPLATLLLALTLCPTAHAKDPADVSRSQHDVTGAVRLSIVTGTIAVRRGDGPKARLVVTRRGKGHEFVEVRVRAEKQGLTVETRYPRDFWQRKDDEGQPLRVSVDIHLTLAGPVASLHCAAVSGAVDVAGVAAKTASLKTVSGPLGASKLTCDALTTRTVSGPVRLSAISARTAALHTVSGATSGALAVTGLTLDTVGGAVAIALTPPAEGAWTVAAKSVSGPVRLSLPATAGARLAAKSVSGTLASDFGAAARKAGWGASSTLSSAFGDARGAIRASSVSGPFRLAKATR